VQWDELLVRILDPESGKLLREHVRQKRGGYRFQQQDVSSRRPYKVSQLLWRAERAGAQIGAFCNHIYNQQGQFVVRRIQGVLSPAKKFGTVATENACGVALEMGVREYRFVRRYLESTPQLSLRQIDPLANWCTIAIFINQKTQEPIGDFRKAWATACCGSVDLKGFSSERLISTWEGAFDRVMESRPRRSRMPGRPTKEKTQLRGRASLNEILPVVGESGTTKT